jgi:hypothetical protein
MGLKMNKLQPGINEVTNAEYHADREYVSSSGLKTAYKSIADFHNQYVLGNKATFGNENAFSEGSLTHSRILEPHQTQQDFVFYNGLRKAGGDWEAFKSGLDPAAATKTIISRPQNLRVDSYLKAFRARPEAVQLITNGLPEHTICAELHGIKVKIRTDWISVERGEISDVKTTGDAADLQSFKSTVDRFGYDFSAALYLEVAEQFYAKKFIFNFIVISKRDPQDCQVYRLSEASRLEGSRKLKIACEKLKFARENNIWTEAISLTNDAMQDTVTTSAYEILEV